MSRFGTLDWVVLALTLLLVICYGVYKSTSTKTLDGYYLSNRSMPWWLVLLSIMGTQASAVTFLSGPGQAFTDGMRFVQYYFGLPLAMVIICISFVPVFHRLKIFTAYEFLEKRFDVKTRTLTSLLFLISRGLSTGISIAAPAIILSSLLGWDVFWTNILTGGLLIIYTVTGGAKAVAYTQQLQMGIIFVGMFLAGYMVVKMLPGDVGFFDALHVSGEAGKLNVFTSGITENGFNWTDRYNIFSGIIGGFFLQLSYFGTDQSQVGRYLTARTLSESRIGLLMNGLVKVPMQFLILLVGALVFTFYQFNSAPIFFNESQLAKVENSKYKDSMVVLKSRFDALSNQKKTYAKQFTDALAAEDVSAQEQASKKMNEAQQQAELVRADAKKIIGSEEVGGDSNDNNYIFLRFVVDYLPAGLVGLLIAIIFLAAWGAIAAALNALSSSTMIDVHKRFSKKQVSENKEYRLSKMYTLMWGVFCVIAAHFAYNIGNSLIEAVNVLGSLFYGVILGIFLVALYVKRVGATAVFAAALIVELYIITSTIWPWLTKKFDFIENTLPDAFNRFMMSASTIGFLWLNMIGAVGVVVLAFILQLFLKRKKEQSLDAVPQN